MSTRSLQNRMAAGIVILACVSASALPAAAKKSKLNPAAVALFEKAVAASDLKAKGAQGFRLQANVRIFRAHNQHVDGVLVEFWTPKGKWREETFLPGYQLVQVSDGRHEWTKNTMNYVPFEVHELWAALAFPPRLLSWIKPTGKTSHVAGTVPGGWGKQERTSLGKPKKEKKGAELCVKTLSSRWRNKGAFCFDTATGQILHETDDGYLTYEFSDYAAFGRKSFPRTLRVIEGDDTEIVEIHIVRIEPLAIPVPATFLPVKGSQEQPDPDACQKVKPVKLSKMVSPAYTPAAKDGEITGTVVLYGYVGKDGIPRGLETLISPSPLLTAPALQAVRQWRYQSTLCEIDGAWQPVPARTFITVVFAP